MSAKVTDTNQEYQYSMPFVTPSGHELSFYDTPENERLVVKHTSGSHIEFKADGSVFIKAVKDIHTFSGANASGGASAAQTDNSTIRQDTDYSMEIGGALRIKCSELELEIGSTGRIIAGTDLITSANNVVTKATESISLEGTKSVYVDTKEMRERVVSRRTEAGTAEEGTPGGVNVMRVHGNTIIQNDDENGGITIASRGYLNLVSGAERTDVIGKYTDRPSQEAEATYTTKVYASSGSMDVSSVPGDVHFESEAGAYYSYAKSTGGSSSSGSDGYKEVVGQGNREREVSVGNETVNITGIQTINAEKIYLN